MSKQMILFALWATASGALIPVLAAMNGKLGKTLDSIPYSVLPVFIAGMLGSIILILASKASLPAVEKITKVPFYYYMSGLIMFFYIVSATFLTPRFGVANTIFFVVVAQIMAATVIDHFGLFGATIQSFDFKRALGIAMLFGGLILARGAPSINAPG
ncbi:MAG: DMT family transporter [Kordiimonas sp.]